MIKPLVTILAAILCISALLSEVTAADRPNLASNLDVVPTLLAAAGVPAPKGLPGIDLLDESAVADREALFLSHYAHDMVSVHEPEKVLWSRSCVSGQWKLISWQQNLPPQVPYLYGDYLRNVHRDIPEKLLQWTRKAENAPFELFHLEVDPRETVNLAEQHPAKV